MDVSRRNQCQACRFRRCLEVNMKRDGIGGILPSIFIHFGRERSFDKDFIYTIRKCVKKQIKNHFDVVNIYTSGPKILPILDKYIKWLKGCIRQNQMVYS